MPMWRQYCHRLAPRFEDASLHSARRPSIAGAMTRIISGIWK